MILKLGEFAAKRRSFRNFAVSSGDFARGRVEKTPVYVDNPFLPAKKTGFCEFPAQIENEIGQKFSDYWPNFSRIH